MAQRSHGSGEHLGCAARDAAPSDHDLLLAVLSVHNVLVRRAVPRRWHWPLRAATLVLLAGAARRAGLTPHELGLGRARLVEGLRWGGAGALLAVASVTAAVRSPVLRARLGEPRYARVGPGGAVLRVLVDIPGTAGFEELAFRGVLLGALRRRLRDRRALLASSVLFGLWHLLPTATRVDASAHTRTRTPAGTAGEVAVTMVAGAGFAALRRASGSVVAPVLVHGATNAAAYAAGWWVVRTRGGHGRP